jgi:hypothetical protein
MNRRIRIAATLLAAVAALTATATAGAASGRPTADTAWYIAPPPLAD